MKQRPANEGGWSGITLAINLADTDAVDTAVQEAVAAGAILVQVGTKRDWGGYSAYVADPEGTRWELAWSPDLAVESAP